MWLGVIANVVRRYGFLLRPIRHLLVNISVADDGMDTRRVYARDYVLIESAATNKRQPTAGHVIVYVVS